MTGPVATQSKVDFLQPMDQIAHQSARCRAACGIAEMRAATEGAGVVNLAQPLFQKRAGTFASRRQLGASAGAPGAGGEHGFATGEVGRFPGELETATGGTAGAVALNRALRQLLVNGPHLGEQRGGVRCGVARGSGLGFA